jgi:hypothetical protein
LQSNGGGGNDLAERRSMTANYTEKNRTFCKWRKGRGTRLKRGIVGAYHHVSKHHLHRYRSEFDFRYNARKFDDGERAILAVIGTTGKRLKYRDSRGSAQGRVSRSN